MPPSSQSAGALREPTGQSASACVEEPQRGRPGAGDQVATVQVAVAEPREVGNADLVQAGGERARLGDGDELVLGVDHHDRRVRGVHEVDRRPEPPRARASRGAGSEVAADHGGLRVEQPAEVRVGHLARERREVVDAAVGDDRGHPRIDVPGPASRHADQRGQVAARRRSEDDDPRGVDAHPVGAFPHEADGGLDVGGLVHEGRGALLLAVVDGDGDVALASQGGARVGQGGTVPTEPPATVNHDHGGAVGALFCGQVGVEQQVLAVTDRVRHPPDDGRFGGVCRGRGQNADHGDGGEQLVRARRMPGTGVVIGRLPSRTVAAWRPCGLHA